MRHITAKPVIAILLFVNSADAAPLLRYSFDEASSGNSNALDTGSAAPAAPGVFNGSATRTSSSPGGFSSVLDLTAGGAVGNFVATAADADKVDALSQMTLTMWINLQGNPSSGDSLLSDRAPTFPIAPAGTGGWDWTIDGVSPTASNFSVRFGTAASNGSSASFTSQGAVTSLNADHSWLFLAVTFDSTDSGRTTFYKGTQFTAPVHVGTVGLLGTTITNNVSAFRVGESGANPASDTTPPAWFDDVRVYGSVLSLAELDAVRLQNVPEPSSIVLATVAVAGLLTCGWRRKQT